MKYDDLQEAYQDPLVPLNLLAEAMLFRIALNECPEKAVSTKLWYLDR